MPRKNYIATHNSSFSFHKLIFQVDRDWTPEDYEHLNPSGLRAISNAMEFIKNPRKMCEEIAHYVQRMVDIINWHKINKSSIIHLLEFFNMTLGKKNGRVLDISNDGHFVIFEFYFLQIENNFALSVFNVQLLQFLLQTALFT